MDRNPSQPAFIRAFERVATLLALLAGTTVIILSLLIAFDILARDLFRFSLQGTDELGGYALALIGSLGLSYTLLRRSHPRIDVFFRYLPLRARAALHVLALATMAGFAVFMTRHAWSELSETLTFGTITNTPLQTPLWVPQAIWVLGSAFFAVTASALAVHAALLFLADPGGVDRLYGPITVEEEVNEYVPETGTETQPRDGDTHKGG